MVSSKSGSWSDPSTWVGNTVPAAGDAVIIDTSHTVTYDAEISNVAGIDVKGTLKFDASKNALLQSTKNVVVTGELDMISNEKNHILRFVGINESSFIGEGMVVVPNDIGLWVMENGKLNLSGKNKTGWSRSKTAISAGQSTITVEDASGWAIGDDIVIVPTGPNASNYDERVIIAINENTLTVNTPLTSHPKIDDFPFAEVINLTRNIKIEGTPNGRSHVFIHSTSNHVIDGVSFKYTGPRKTQQGFANSLVAGRYGLHFHHAENGSRGTIVRNCLVSNSGSHSFVPHSSYGIYFDTCATYNTIEDAYWYDLGHSTHDLTFDTCIAARVNYVPRSLDMDLWAIDKSDKVPSLGANGFLLGRGDGNKIFNCVVVGTQGDPHTKGGYFWPTRNENAPEGVWDFHNNLAHNCNLGVGVWQNTGLNHTNVNFFAYSNTLDIFHGAYNNSYVYKGGHCNGLSEIKAASGDRLRFINMKFNQIRLLGSALSSNKPIFFLNCTWNSWIDAVTESVHNADIIDCEGPISITGLNTEVVRVQPKTGQSYRLTKSGKTNISVFAPKIWGTGTGLKGEYFSEPNFTGKLFERLDNIIAFGDWGNLIHHLVGTDTRISVRWTGKILPQFTERYTFTMGGGGSMKLWINDAQVTSNINLEAGKLYNIKIEFTNNDTNIRGGANFSWNSPSLNLLSPGGELVPELQLYPGEATPPEPPVNQTPTANAGPNAEITLPINFTVLAGTGNDNDGTIVAYKWEKISGGNAEILSINNQTTQVRNLEQGNYIFKFEVTDDKGAKATDLVEVKVNPAPVINIPPSADAGSDSEFIVAVPLDGSASDSDGTIIAVSWTCISRPAGSSLPFISNPTILKTKASGFSTLGEYVFELVVMDDKNEITSDRKTVIVKE